MSKRTHAREKAVFTRRGLLGAGGSMLAGAVAAGLAAPADASAQAGAAAANNAPVFDLGQMPLDPDSGPGGTVQMARQAQFPFMSGATVARVAMKPGCSRAPHWHFNSWEVQFCVSGAFKLSCVDGHGVVHEGIVRAGAVGFAPQGWLHTLEAVGSEPCVMHLCWGDPALQTQELAQAMGMLPAPAVAGTLDISVAQLGALNKSKRLVTRNAT